MTKILFLIDSLNGGGAERALINLLNNFDYSQYDVTIETLYDVGVFKKSVNKRAKYISSNLPKIRGLNYLMKFLSPKILHKLIVKEKYDIEVSFLEGITTKVISGAKKNVKTACFVRIDIEQHPRSKTCYISKKQMVNCYTRMNKIAFVGYDSMESFKKDIGIKDNLVVVRNIVETENMITKSNENVEYKNKKKPLFLSVGRLNYQKGYDRLLDVSKRLINEGLKFSILIIGKGVEKENLEKYIMENDLSEFVEILDFQENPFKYIKACDWFVSSSRFEGFSSVIREAVILGKPIIATKVAGVTELLGNNEYGITVENNSDDLFQGMRKIILDESLKIKYEKKVSEIQCLFDMDKQIRDNLDFYKSLKECG